MNIHKNARLTFARRLEMVHDVLEHGATLAATAVSHGVSVPTVRKWAARFLLHIDTKKLGRIERMGKRIPGSSRNPIGAGWEYLFVAIDDHARIGFTQMKPNERRSCAIAFLHASIRYFAHLGVTVRRVLTDN